MKWPFMMVARHEREMATVLSGAETMVEAQRTFAEKQAKVFAALLIQAECAASQARQRAAAAEEQLRQLAEPLRAALERSAVTNIVEDRGRSLIHVDLQVPRTTFQVFTGRGQALAYVARGLIHGLMMRLHQHDNQQMPKGTEDKK